MRYFILFLIFILQMSLLRAQNKDEWYQQQIEGGKIEKNQQEPEMIQRSGMLAETGDILLDYRGLMNQIDQMRQHEQEVIGRIEQIATDYENKLSQLENLIQSLETQKSDFQKWYEDSEKKRLEEKNAWGEPMEIKGKITAPSERYYSR